MPRVLLNKLLRSKSEVEDEGKPEGENFVANPSEAKGHPQKDEIYFGPKIRNVADI